MTEPGTACLSDKRYAACPCTERERSPAASEAWLKQSPLTLVDCFAIARNAIQPSVIRIGTTWLAHESGHESLSSWHVPAASLFVQVLRRLASNSIYRDKVYGREEGITQRNDSITSEASPFLIVDGVWVTIQYPTTETWTDKSRYQRQRVRAEERVILAVMGVWPDGRHALLHYTIATTEDTTAWLRVFEEVRMRGLDSAAITLVVSDGTKGLSTAMKTHLPTARLQR